MRRVLPILAAAPALAGCQGIQSALWPAGEEARGILLLSIVLFAGAAVIFTGVAALLFWSVFSRRREDRRSASHRLVIGGGLIFPVLVLTPLVAFTAWTGGRIARPAPPDALRIEVIGHMWWWEVRYLLPGGEVVETANELWVPVGRPVEYILRSEDVIHSFWVPRLAGKLDLIPGRVNRMVATATEPGIMRGQCAEFCGEQHAWMAFYMVAATPPEFEEWLRRQAAPAREPDDPFLVAGREAFLAAGCGTCHQVRGTQAWGELGPDLTHVGSRITLAAGLLPNTLGALGGWIADAQHLKPANRMPSFGQALEPENLRAIAAYLESLE